MLIEEDAQTIQAFTDGQLTHEQALKLLRVCNNDVERALGRFFDEGLAVIENESYDSSAFHADRYGANDGGGGASIPSFNIDYAPGVDHYPHSGTASLAPSRPPSRTSHHSARGDTPIQSIETGQESGIIGSTSKPAFGPANRDYYENNSWALVPAAKSMELIPDAMAQQRKREEKSPAIIKPLPSGDYLPALLAIINTIPLYRNALLAPEVSLDNYNAGEEWWKGDAWPQARTIDYEDNRDNVLDLDIMHEAQRLMAFLDSTDRAYGSVGGLQQLEVWKASRATLDREDDELLKFLLNWATSYQKQTNKQLRGILTTEFIAGGQSQDSFLLDVNLVHSDPGADITLYDAMDESLLNPDAMAYIVAPSDVVILRLHNPKPNATTLDCKIPATFYADRYLEKNRGVVEAMLQEMKQYNNQVKDLNEKADKLKYHTTQTIRKGERVETLKLLKTSMIAFQPTEDLLIENPDHATILFQLQSVYDNIERKLAMLEEQTKKVRETLDGISSRFRAPFHDGTGSDALNTDEDPSTSQSNLTHAYTLRGVCTSSNVVYLCQPDAITNDSKPEDTADGRDWWRIEYSTATTDVYILRERLSLSSVLEKANSDHHSALLVYANEAAMSPAPIPLSAPLQQFVKEDNVRFLEELQRESGSGTWDTTGDPPFEPLAGWNYDVPASYESHTNGPSSQVADFVEPWVKANVEREKVNSWRADSSMSSTTLTPNTDVEDEAIHSGGLSELREMDDGGGVDVVGDATRVRSDAASLRDVEMVDVELGDVEKEEAEMQERSQGGGARVFHIEDVEKKDG